jgi:hypothetical protein
MQSHGRATPTSQFLTGGNRENGVFWGGTPAALGGRGSAEDRAPGDDTPPNLQTSTDATPPKQDALAEIRKFIGDRGTKPAETVFHNIKLLKGKPASVLPGMMSALTKLLGVSCSHCHVSGHWDSDEKPAKQMTRQQFEMQEAINTHYFKGEEKVTCWTCHRGQAIPEGLPRRK